MQDLTENDKERLQECAHCMESDNVIIEIFRNGYVTTPCMKNALLITATFAHQEMHKAISALAEHARYFSCEKINIGQVKVQDGKTALTFYLAIPSKEKTDTDTQTREAIKEIFALIEEGDFNFPAHTNRIKENVLYMEILEYSKYANALGLQITITKI